MTRADKKRPRARKTPSKASNGKKPDSIDIEADALPRWITEAALPSGDFPYDKALSKKKYARDLEALQVELVKAQTWMRAEGRRVVALFEGRDGAGKGGSIRHASMYMNPRWVRSVALDKPTERERTQWYFQRYVKELPSAGEMILFDRSWYNRAGVEPVMGFCTEAEHRAFLEEVPAFERTLINDGVFLVKIWLNIGREMQIQRFHDRRHDPRRRWKFSPMDRLAMDLWEEYTSARDSMLQATHTTWAPWTVIRANDKRRARLFVMRRMLQELPYPDRDDKLVLGVDPLIVGGPELLSRSE